MLVGGNGTYQDQNDVKSKVLSKIYSKYMNGQLNESKMNNGEISSTFEKMLHGMNDSSLRKLVT